MERVTPGLLVELDTPGILVEQVTPGSIQEQVTPGLLIELQAQDTPGSIQEPRNTGPPAYFGRSPPKNFLPGWTVDITRELS